MCKPSVEFDFAYWTPKKNFILSIGIVLCYCKIYFEMGYLNNMEIIFNHKLIVSLINRIINYKNVIAIFGIPLLFGATCNKEEGVCGNRKYSFNVTSEFIPQKEVYKVGDTIFLTSVFPKLLTDMVTTQQINYSNTMGIGGYLNFTKLDSAFKRQEEALYLSMPYPIIGNLRSVADPSLRLGLGVHVQYFKDIDRFELKLGLILNSKGLFYLQFSNLASTGLNDQSCSSADFMTTVTNSNKHLYLFKNALGYQPDSMYAKNIYCFRVE